MCGISGVILFNETSKVLLNTDILNSMGKVMELRGPDDSGTYISEDKKVGFCHKRLSIIDLSEKGHQPMSNSDETIWITFNGEIYNYKEIRKQLIDKGYVFNSESDTEVIIYAYEEWGIQCLDQFNGQFSFALLDQREGNNDLFLIRDRFGIKPMFYSWIDEGNALVFASSVSSVIKHPDVDRTISLSAISDYLSFRYALGSSTFFKNIKKLLPGHYMHFDLLNQKHEIIRYYNLSEKVNKLRNNPDKNINYKSEVYRIFKDAVKYRLRSHVPFGAYLSGGVDSSAVVATMSSILDEPVRTYTIGFEEENEFRYASMVAEQFDTIHKEILQTPDEYFSIMKWLIEQKGEPLGVPNEIPLYQMSKILKEDITVVLSGEGADEIFMGYGRIFRIPEDYRKMTMSVLPTFLKKRIFPKLYQKYQNLHSLSFLDLFIHRYTYSPLAVKDKVFNKKSKNEIKEERGANEMNWYKQFFTGYFNEVQNWSLESQISYVFEMVHLPNLLQRVDNSTLSTSVEARVPFLDHNLVERVLSLPKNEKLKWKSSYSKLKAFFKSSDEISENYDIPKFLLKEIFDGKIPEEVLYRKKKGFPVPLGSFFDEKGFGELAKKYLLNETSYTKEILNQKMIKELVNLFDGSWESGYFLWQLLNLELWLRYVFEDKVN